MLMSESAALAISVAVESCWHDPADLSSWTQVRTCSSDPHRLRLKRSSNGWSMGSRGSFR